MCIMSHVKFYFVRNYSWCFSFCNILAFSYKILSLKFTVTTWLVLILKVVLLNWHCYSKVGRLRCTDSSSQLWTIALFRMRMAFLLFNYYEYVERYRTVANMSQKVLGNTHWYWRDKKGVKEWLQSTAALQTSYPRLWMWLDAIVPLIWLHIFFSFELH